MVPRNGEDAELVNLHAELSPPLQGQAPFLSTPDGALSKILLSTLMTWPRHCLFPRLPQVFHFIRLCFPS